MKMIGTLQTLLNEGQGNYSSLLGTSDSSRLATISALGSQFQRLSQAAPIRGSIPVMTSRSCVLWNDTDQGVFNKDTKASRQDGMDKTMWKGSHCKVCAEADESNVWVQRRNRPELYKVPKQHLSRMHHMWKDTDQGMLNTFCKVQCGTGKYFTFKKGRRCTVFDINQRNATEVWVKFISSWEPNAGYRVPKSCLNPVYPGGYKGVPTSVYVP
jgi:hypothetical protein